MNEQVTSPAERAEHPVAGRTARVPAMARPVTRALVLAGLTTAAALALRSPEAATDTVIALPWVAPDFPSDGNILPISVSAP